MVVTDGVVGMNLHLERFEKLELIMILVILRKMATYSQHRSSHLTSAVLAVNSCIELSINSSE